MFNFSFYKRIPVGKIMYLFIGAYGNLNGWDFVIRARQYSLDQEVASKHLLSSKLRLWFLHTLFFPPSTFVHAPSLWLGNRCITVFLKRRLVPKG